MMKDVTIRNKYDYWVYVIIMSMIFFGSTFGFFSPTRLLGGFAFLYLIFSHEFKCFLMQLKCRSLKFLYLIFLLYIVVSVYWINDFKSYSIASIDTFCRVFITLFLFFCTIKSKGKIKTLIGAWMLFLIANLYVAFWEISTGNHLSAGSYQADSMMMSYDGIMNYRMYAAVTYGNLNSFSLLLCLLLLFVLLWMSLGSNRQKMIGIVVIIMISIVLIINTSRASLLCLLLFLIVFMKSFSVKQRYALLSLLFFACLILYVEYEDEIYFLINRKLENRGGLIQDQSRILLAEKSMKIIYKYGG